MHQILFGAPPQTPLGELTALPETPELDLRGLLLRGGGRREGKGSGGEGRERNGRGRKGGDKK